MYQLLVLIGNVGKVEAFTTKNGNELCNFTLATNEKWRAKDGTEKEKTTWHNCVAFGKVGAFLGKNLQVGAKLFAEGKIDVSTVDDENGGKKYFTKVIVNNVKFLSPKNKASAVGDEQPGFPVDDVPF